MNVPEVWADATCQEFGIQLVLLDRCIPPAHLLLQLAQNTFRRATLPASEYGKPFLARSSLNPIQFSRLPFSS
ncbi:unnamed protein product [Haemonchus placei]|uniref:Uncharacterized protein n=1 Tax=Haemonchus placei TaxID=6290 RepID=A0A3P7Y0W0_HAEPC|nr:unnamed protein product [Haemonchus placei]